MKLTSSDRSPLPSSADRASAHTAPQPTRRAVLRGGLLAASALLPAAPGPHSVVIRHGWFLGTQDR